MKHSSPNLNLHQALSNGLKSLGVTHLFGLVGDANLFMVNDFVGRGLGRYVACTHEANAVLAALGYAQVTGRTGVASITHGPALTNVVTALSEGVKGGIPLVVLCGDTAPGDLQHIQKIDQREVVSATGAGFVEMRSPETALVDLERAFRLAEHQRRPIVFNSRVDLQWAEAPVPELAMSVPALPRASAPEAALEEAVAMIAASRRPVVLAGRGALNARDQILRFATRIGAPVATTLKAQGLFRGAPFDLGIFGGLSHPTAVEVIGKSDCIIAFGASLSKHTTELGAFTRAKRVIQILPDMIETVRLDRPSLRLIGDAGATATAMIALYDMADLPSSQATDGDLAAQLAAEAVAAKTVCEPRETAPGTVDFVPALQRLNRALPEQRALVADLGRFVTTAWANLPVIHPCDLVYTCHFGGIGCGLGEAIGVAAACTDRPTVLVAGDGGFLLSGLSELATVRRENFDLVILLCNDGSYGAEHVQLTNRDMDPGLSMLSTPDFSAVAKAMGLRSLRVTDAESLSEACAAVAERSGPILVDLRLDPTKIAM